MEMPVRNANWNWFGMHSLQRIAGNLGQYPGNYLLYQLLVQSSQQPFHLQIHFPGKIFSTSAWGRGMTCTDFNSPTFPAAAAPASTAAFTAPTSPRTITVT